MVFSLCQGLSCHPKLEQQGEGSGEPRRGREAGGRAEGRGSAGPRGQEQTGLGLI